MRQVNITINIDFCSMDELARDERELVQMAIDATKNSYAKYSKFYVGAAVRLEDGQVFIGANQENAAFPSGLCAERTAIFSAQANSPGQAITTIAVAARNNLGPLDNPVTPCGGCRQVMLEMEDRYQRDVKVLLYGKKGIYRIKSVKDLLPLSFVDSNMK
ncbi:cytidine deaminase [Prevotella sp. S7-1-8]|uniref:cytidine deaminase n=1 Tax=Prevotella sp. S7-1-8 TaxID=1284775 RepID=UPI000510406D|nr:cytidine deaminase [Prevotella sp. S7-1-8]KGF17237.1 cytidine deaminase [Prevotella sp. S7-1-8]